MYRVGASIFYFKSELKHSATSAPTVNPFSPPRPSAQSMLSSPVKLPTPVQPQSSSRSHYGNVPSNAVAGAVAAPKHNPTIIKRATENNNSISKYPPGDPQGSFRSSSGSSDWSDFSQNSASNHQQQQQRYGNIPTMQTWDEPPALNRPMAPPPVAKIEPTKPQVIHVPTIIKPVSSNKPSLLPKPALKGKAPSAPITNQSESFQQIRQTMESGIHQRNYYDDPPDSDFEEEDGDDDDFNEDSFASPPMPSEPPPPPPPEAGAVDDWVDSTKDAPAYHEPAFENHVRTRTSFWKYVHVGCTD
jgi:hypothetical protein